MTPCIKVSVTDISVELPAAMFRVEVVFVTSALKKETTGFSDWVLRIYQSTRRNTPEDMQLHPAGCACIYREQDECQYRCAPISTGNTFQDLPQLRETADNTESGISG
jgi:hypothetical protein